MSFNDLADEGEHGFERETLSKDPSAELCSFLVYGGKRRKGVSCWMKQNTSEGIHHE
jgi:hypothetical protein